MKLSYKQNTELTQAVLIRNNGCMKLGYKQNTELTQAVLIRNNTD
jgi:hypothetical protein